MVSTIPDQSDGAALSDARVAAASPAAMAFAHAWSRDPLADWLVDHGGQPVALEVLLKAVAEQLCDDGVPLFKVNMGLRSMHPEVAAKTVSWQRGRDGVTETDHGYGMQLSPSYRASPVRLIHEGAGGFRRRLEGPEPTLDFPILHELLQQGCTDYAIMPLVYSNGEVSFVSWASDRPGGFSTENLTRLYDLLPLIALRVELDNGYEVTRTLLTTYLGREPARRVLAGSVRRGQVEHIRAVVFVSDLRDFTRMTDQLAPRAVIALIDDYFETLGRAIEARGGEVLKFVGDGLLAIFNTGPDTEDDCRNAYEAAQEALAALADENAERTGEGQPAIHCGIALHLGDVLFGNIGARERLDFTVIGPAVNEAVRVEALCKTLDRSLLTTAAFAEAGAGLALESLGHHALRGLAAPREVFGLKRANAAP